MENFSGAERAYRIMQEKGYTFVALNFRRRLSSKERGVKPLLRLLDNSDTLFGLDVADRVIGKAAAFLYVLLEARSIRVGVISESALRVLERYGIPVRADLVVPAIRNRTDTGFCPMESAVREIEGPHEALTAILWTQKALDDGSYVF